MPKAWTVAPEMNQVSELLTCLNASEASSVSREVADGLVIRLIRELTMGCRMSLKIAKSVNSEEGRD